MSILSHITGKRTTTRGSTGIYNGQNDKYLPPHRGASDGGRIPHEPVIQGGGFRARSRGGVGPGRIGYFVTVDNSEERQISPQIGTSNTNDQLIQRNRGPWMHVGYYLPPPVTEISWTAAGPARPELHMRQGGYRRWSGADNQFYEGMHSNGPAGTALTNKRILEKVQMTPPVQNPITVPRYRGQSYSQTTRVSV